MQQGQQARLASPESPESRAPPGLLAPQGQPESPELLDLQELMALQVSTDLLDFKAPLESLERLGRQVRLGLPAPQAQPGSLASPG